MKHKPNLTWYEKNMVRDDVKPMFPMQDVRCPECFGRLGTRYSSVICLDYGKEFKFYGDIIELVGKTFPYLGEIPQNDMQRVLDIARTEGYTKALSYVLERFPNLTSYVSGSHRTDWICSIKHFLFWLFNSKLKNRVLTKVGEIHD